MLSAAGEATDGGRGGRGAPGAKAPWRAYNGRMNADVVGPVFITGASGMLGLALTSLCDELDLSCHPYPEAHLDITDAVAVAAAIARFAAQSGGRGRGRQRRRLHGRRSGRSTRKSARSRSTTGAPGTWPKRRPATG